MKIARLSLAQGPRFAVLDEASHSYHVLADDPIYAGFKTTGQTVALDEAQLVSPMIPRSKVAGVGDNYNIGEHRPDPHAMPPVFIKPNTAVIGPDVPIVMPHWASELRHEAELAVIISRMCKDVPVERAEEVIFGYTVANDIAAVFTSGDAPWAPIKGFDSACPLGPVMVTDLNVDDLQVSLSVNGEERGRGTTADLVRPVPELIAMLSSFFTLLPGDVILTGVPFAAVAAGPGEEVVCEVEGIGQLRNPIVGDEE
ncbi:fumarylacetoacetate hydrolase family protein [Trueperella sp. LYQ143]|uniref:fumarylacetoacetate hydrolase family protein n=1 Tax=unclassified Trueperella TaxID=2630174 RepID=UPI003982E248